MTGSRIFYHRALTRAPAERRAFLEQACAGDQTLRAEVESLLSYEAPSFLETPAAHLIAGGTASAAGGDPHQVTTSGGDVPYESADGRTLFYLRPIDGVNTVFSMPLAGGAERHLGIAVTFWNYLPVERGLYYVSVRQGQRAPYTFDVRFLDFSAKQSRTLYTARLAGASPGISATPDGKAVLIAGTAEITQDLMRIEHFR